MNHIALAKLESRKHFAFAQLQEQLDSICEANSDPRIDELLEKKNLKNITMQHVVQTVINDHCSCMERHLNFFIEALRLDQSDNCGTIYKELIITIIGIALVKMDIELTQDEFKDIWE